MKIDGRTVPKIIDFLCAWGLFKQLAHVTGTLIHITEGGTLRGKFLMYFQDFLCLHFESRFVFFSKRFGVLWAASQATCGNFVIDI